MAKKREAEDQDGPTAKKLCRQGELKEIMREEHVGIAS